MTLRSKIIKKKKKMQTEICYSHTGNSTGNEFETYMQLKLLQYLFWLVLLTIDGYGGIFRVPIYNLYIAPHVVKYYSYYNTYKI